MGDLVTVMQLVQKIEDNGHIVRMEYRSQTGDENSAWIDIKIFLDECHYYDWVDNDNVEPMESECAFFTADKKDQLNQLITRLSHFAGESC